MRLQGILYLLTLFVTINALAGQNGGAGEDTSTASATSIWVTITSDGAPVVVQTTYSQSFMETYTSAKSDDVKSGGVGLGSSATESVGQIRSYDQTTISQSNIAVNHNYGGSFTALVALVVGFLL